VALGKKPAKSLGLKPSATICVRGGVIYLNRAKFSSGGGKKWVKVDNPADFGLVKYVDLAKDADYKLNKVGLFEEV
jgi:hypothetical protein